MQKYEVIMSYDLSDKETTINIDIPVSQIASLPEHLILHILSKSPNIILNIPNPTVEMLVLVAKKSFFILTDIVKYTEEAKAALIELNPSHVKFFCELSEELSFRLIELLDENIIKNTIENKSVLGVYDNLNWLYNITTSDNVKMMMVLKYGNLICPKREQPILDEKPIYTRMIKAKRDKLNASC